jgi:hypothetical protein
VEEVVVQTEGSQLGIWRSVRMVEEEQCSCGHRWLEEDYGDVLTVDSGTG